MSQCVIQTWWQIGRPMLISHSASGSSFLIFSTKVTSFSATLTFSWMAFAWICHPIRQWRRSINQSKVWKPINNVAHKNGPTELEVKVFLVVASPRKPRYTQRPVTCSITCLGARVIPRVMHSNTMESPDKQHDSSTSAMSMTRARACPCVSHPAVCCSECQSETAALTGQNPMSKQQNKVAVSNRR